MIPKSLLLFAAVLWTATPAFAQVVPPPPQTPRTPAPPAPTLHDISGKLLFATARPPDERIEVHLTRNLQRITSVFSDSLGNFEFRGLQAGSYSISVRYPGYEDVDQQVEIYSMQKSVSVPIQMNPTVSIIRRPSGFQGDDPNILDVDQIRDIPKKAVQAYEKALEENRKGQTAKAIRLFEEAIKIAPDFYHAHNNLGVAYVRMSRYEEAEAEYKKARELNPKVDQPLLNLALLYITQADARRAEGRPVYGKLLDDAMDLLDAAIKIKPNSAYAHYYLGTAYYKSEFYEEAEKSLKRAGELDPRLSNVRLMLINVYIKQQQWNEVVAQIDAYLKENPKAEERKNMEELRLKIVKSLSPAI